MKKLITILIALVGITALAGRGPEELRTEFKAESATNRANIATWYSGVTEAEWRGYGDWCVSVASTNHPAASLAIYSPSIIHYMVQFASEAFVAEYDQKLSAAGMGTGFPYRYYKLPKLAEMWLFTNTT